MKKIPTIFKRDWNGDKSRVTDEVNPECLWVFKGEGSATRKYDGTAVRVLNGELWVRFDAKNGKQPPEGFEPAQTEADTETGHWPGWIRPAAKQHKWQIVAFQNSTRIGGLTDGTYEACGPHFQGNPEHFGDDLLIFHGVHGLGQVPLTFAGLAGWFKGKDIEGVVWHHRDGRMAKIKKRDFGLRRIE